MLHYDRVDALEGVDMNKSRDWIQKYTTVVMIYRWWVYELKDIVILNVKFVDYWCIILDICGSDAFNMLSNYKLDVNSSL